MKFYALIAVALLSGCANTGWLENRVACTVARDKAFFISEYGPVGISAAVSDKDRIAICR